MSEVHVQQRAQIREESPFAEQIEAAINAHGEWKIRLLKAIENSCADLEPDKIRKDNLCVLGRWLYSEAVRPYQDELYEKVRQKHAQFHELTADIVLACHEGRVKEARLALRNPSSKFNQTTRELISLLKIWKAKFSEETNVLQEKEEMQKRPIRHYFTIASFLFGFFFIFLGYLITCWQHGIPFELSQIRRIYELSYANYVIGLAPLVLSIFGYFIGRYIDKNIRLNEEKRIIARQEKALRESLHDNQILLDNMVAGLILFDQNFKIRLHSLSATTILENSELMGRDLVQIFQGLLDEANVKDLANYMDLMKNPSYSEDMLDMLNPLDNLHILPKKGMEEKFIKAKMQRIYDVDERIMGFLLVMEDITALVKAKKKAEAEARRADQQAKYVDSILQMDPLSVLSFEQSVTQEIAEANDLLRQASPGEYRIVLPELYRIIHTIKGTSALFGFSLLADLAHEYEESIRQMLKKEEIKPLDFLPLSIKQVKILEELRKIKSLIEKIRQFSQAKPSDIIRRNLEKYREVLIQETGKSFDLDLLAFSDDAIPIEHVKEWTDIFAQLMRNSLAHGLESPQERRERGKSEIGKITVKSYLEEKDKYVVIYEDDGRSFNIEKIKERALMQNLVTQEKLAQMSDAEVIELIFAPGFSTAEITDKNAGRGMGMDILRHLMVKMNGKLRIQWQRGFFTRFIFEVPVKNGDKGKAQDETIAVQAL
ncbi:MAG: CZB domain-containing protein [Leptospiraceae bacterium]|nr:CZB domain-containing protein [Leptospiraceae bacterium]MDW8305756.1 CZB domain-containing protein [Leptospiraceae bacterium]